MLVLTRKKNEQIMIDKDIVVTIVEIQNGRVRIGIEAPKTIPVLRSELINWKNDDGMTEQQRQAKASAETIDVNLADIGEDTLDSDSLSGFILPKDVSAAITKPNAGSPESTEQSVSKSS